jgi:hypothetical protein
LFRKKYSGLNYLVRACPDLQNILKMQGIKEDRNAGFGARKAMA